MLLLLAILFLVAGVFWFWVAISGRTIYYGRLGVPKRGPSTPMPPGEARVMATLLGIFFLFLGIWALLHAKLLG